MNVYLHFMGVLQEYGHAYEMFWAQFKINADLHFPVDPFVGIFYSKVQLKLGQNVKVICAEDNVYICERNYN